MHLSCENENRDTLGSTKPSWKNQYLRSVSCIPLFQTRTSARSSKHIYIYAKTNMDWSVVIHKKTWYIMCMHLYTYYLYHICSCVIYKYSQYSNKYTEIDKHLYSLSWIIRLLFLSCILHPWCQSCPLTVRHLYATSLTPVIGVTWAPQRVGGFHLLTGRIQPTYIGVK